tara:strand:+ start:150 stop:770 length:621 start_codon:yes stop_codon:yes gene_type:complete
MIDFEVVNNYSNIVSKLSIFLFIVAGNLVADIYSCGIRHLLKEYMIIKHIVGFFIMLFFVGLVQDKLDIKSKFSQSIILYIWFVFIMRAPMIISIITIILITTIYLINLYITDLKNKLEENEKQTEENSKLINKFTFINNILFIISFLISIIGTLIFLFVLKKKLGNKFNIFNFLLGTRDQECYKKNIYKIFKKHPLFFEKNMQNL